MSLQVHKCKINHKPPLCFDRAYDEYADCVGTSLNGCHEIVTAAFESVDNMFGHICGTGKAGTSTVIFNRSVGENFFSP